MGTVHIFSQGLPRINVISLLEFFKRGLKGQSAKKLLFFYYYAKNTFISYIMRFMFVSLLPEFVFVQKSRAKQQNDKRCVKFSLIVCFS